MRHCQFPANMPCADRQHFHCRFAVHAIPFIVFHRSLFLFGLSDACHPAGKIPSVDPNMSFGILDVWCAIYQPVPQRALHSIKLFCQFMNGVVHWEQPGGLYDHGMWQFEYR